MTTKTDLASITLTNAEMTTGHARGSNPAGMLAEAKLQAQELATTLAEILKWLPAGTNATSLTAIRAALL